MPYSLKMALDQTRHNLGSSCPRAFSNDQLTLYPPPPDWAARDDLSEVLARREQLMTRGQVVLSARVMANQTLYFVGSTPSASAMVVVWSPDPFFEEHADELALVASEAVALKNTSPGGDEAEAACLLTDEMSRPQSVPLPRSLTQGRDVFLSALLVWRAHLPCGFLSGTLLPILVLPGETRAALIVPGQFWSDEFKDR